MLKGIDQRLSAEVVHVLMLMGHDDDLVVSDVNPPAATIAADISYGRLIDMAGCDIAMAARAIRTLMPLDSFVEAPITRMQVVGDPTATGRSLPECKLSQTAQRAAACRCKVWSFLAFTLPQNGPSPSSARPTAGPTDASF